MTLDGFELLATFLAVVALSGWLNVRFAHLPTAVAMLLAGSFCAVLLVGLREFELAPSEVDAFLKAIREVDFQEAVLGYLLAFLLFAGAVQVDFAELRRRFVPISSLATIGVLVSTLLVGGGLWAVARMLGLELPFAWALTFGALISPTDPIAVLATVRSGQFSQNLKSILLGEALFNDGVGIVIFAGAVSLATAEGAPNVLALGGAVLAEGLGGLVFGALAGALAVRALRAIDDYAVEVSVTIALAMGVYAVAQAVGVSGPIAVVGAGLLVGERGFETAMSDLTRRYVRGLWTLVDEILNAALFLLLGLELAVAPPRPEFAGMALAAVLLVTAARWITVAPWGLYFRLKQGERGATTVLAWGGVHGAISVALALSAPAGPWRAEILTITYVVVLCSIVIQGLSFPSVARKLAPPTQSTQPAEGG